MRKERLKNENQFPFFFYPFAHSSLMIVYILLKKFKFCWETPPIKKSAPHRNLSIDLHCKSVDWFPYETSLYVTSFRKDIK